MTSIYGATISPVVSDRSKPVKLPDDFSRLASADSGFSMFLQSELSGVSPEPDNRPDNIWGRISLPNGDTATIYNKGGVETDHTTLDIDWSVDGEIARAAAIMAKYGGTLEIADTADPNSFIAAGLDPATLLSTILDSTAFAERILNGSANSLIPDDLMAETG